MPTWARREAVPLPTLRIGTDHRPCELDGDARLSTGFSRHAFRLSAAPESYAPRLSRMTNGIAAEISDSTAVIAVVMTSGPGVPFDSSP